MNLGDGTPNRSSDRRQRACPAGILIITTGKGSQVKVGKKDLERTQKKGRLGQPHHVLPRIGRLPRHVSARIPGTRRFFIKPVLAPLGEIAPKHVIPVDIDEYMEVCEQNYAKASNQRTVTKLKNPPRETMIHAAIYHARPEVNSVVHTHQTIATAFFGAGTPILPIYNQAAVLLGDPIFPSPRLIYTCKMARRYVKR